MASAPSWPRNTETRNETADDADDTDGIRRILSASICGICGEKVKAVIALGSNLGDRRAHLAAGLAALRTLGTVVPSPLVMETPDESGTGPAYLNTCLLYTSDAADE